MGKARSRVLSPIAIRPRFCSAEPDADAAGLYSNRQALLPILQCPWPRVSAPPLPTPPNRRDTRALGHLLSALSHHWPTYSAALSADCTQLRDGAAATGAAQEGGRSMRVPSSLALLLRDSAWLPDESGENSEGVCVVQGVVVRGEGLLGIVARAQSCYALLPHKHLRAGHAPPFPAPHPTPCCRQRGRESPALLGHHYAFLPHKHSEACHALTLLLPSMYPCRRALPPSPPALPPLPGSNGAAG